MALADFDARKRTSANSYSEEYISERRVVLQDEMDATYYKACAAATTWSFVVVMWLTLPTGPSLCWQIAMGNPCNECYKQQEMVYWTKMKYILFYQILIEGFHLRLAIPEKFARKLGDRLPEKVTLRDPSYNTRDVKVVKTEGGLFFEDGWGEFAEDLCLRENDMCVFKYDGQSLFEVSIFDGSTLCERESSHFYLNHQCACKETTQREAEAMQDSAVESRSQGDDSVTVAHRPKPHGKQVVRNPGTSIYTGFPKRKRSNLEVTRSDTTKRIGKPKAKSGDTRHKRNDQVFYSDTAECTGQPKAKSDYISLRRDVTPDEMKSAYAKANAAFTPGSLLVAMRPTHVYRDFFVEIPTEWARSHLPNKDVTVTLRVTEGLVTKNETWPVKFLYENGGLSYGWKRFSVANKLEEGDVCVFELDSHTDDFIVMNVTIFRVLQETTPLLHNSVFYR